MVSLWPWRSDDTSPASFERALSTLSTKISKSQQLLDQLHQNSRRFKALWTLYTSFIYLLCVVILALVVGWKNWGPWEYSAIAGSPLFIYLIRQGITTYYSYRVDAATYKLGEQQKERAKTIDKLKDATKYNSTQQLLEKYGGAPAQPSSKYKGQTGPPPAPRKIQKQPQRMSAGPPATANIPQNLSIAPPPPTPQQLTTYTSFDRAPPSLLNPPLSHSMAGAPEFAPNAFGSVPQYDRNLESNAEGKWYDRILDLLLGDDETSPKNRIVLICKHCRLVNGQAPPGVKRIEDLGKWRCIGCGEWNGDIDEGVKIVEEIKQTAEAEAEAENLPDESRLSEKGTESLSNDEGKDSDGKALEEEEYEEVNGGDATEEETTTRKTRSSHRSDTSLKKT